MEKTRSWLLGVLTLALIGMGTELAFIGHVEEWTQVIPVALIGMGLIAALALWVKPGAPAVQLFRVVSGLFIVAGALGIYLHYRGNAEFELEMRPTMAGLELLWNSLTGATPALAPGSMIPIGLIGLITTYRHPAATRESDAARTEGER